MEEKEIFKEINYEGIGHIRILDDKVRRGINAVEAIVYSEIARGSDTDPKNIIIKKKEGDILMPTIINRKQVIEIASNAYDAVQEGYGYFSEIAKQIKEYKPNYNFRKWVCEEILRRVVQQASFISTLSPLDTEVANELVAKRDRIFNKHVQDKGLNAAQKRHRDVILARDIAKMCWERKISDSQICLYFQIDESKLNEIRKRTFYLREVRALAIMSRDGKQLEKWIKNHLTKTEWFAERMGIREDVAKELFNDLYTQHVLNEDIK